MIEFKMQTKTEKKLNGKFVTLLFVFFASFSIEFNEIYFSIYPHISRWKIYDSLSLALWQW